MTLATGTRLGPYEIVALIGAGGMGEVYKARDPRLGRDVAIKVLPAAFSADPDRLRRFEQEARAAAALNHPNILAVHDIGQHDGAPFIVSELLDGETLRARLSDGVVPVRKAVDFAVQIANGLAAAHDKGIVHRDLKPENLFVAADSRVKILDFGLAKLTESAEADDDDGAGGSALPTGSPTEPGVVLGTIGYMAPEQVRGRRADHRADLFAFGAILYEMLSGRRAFHRDTSADTMTAILKEDPPDLPTDARHIPPALERIVARCLEKNAAARFQSTSDLAFALNSLSAHSGETDAVGAVGRAGWAEAGRHVRRERLAWTLVAVLGAVCVTALSWAGVAYIRRPSTDTRTMQVFVSPPDGWSLTHALGPTGAAPTPLAVSPDGLHIAFLARNADSRDRLWVRSLDVLSAKELSGTDGATSPFWSPDSRFLGFFAEGKLKKIDLTGGPPITLCDAPDNRGGTWSRDGVIVFSPAVRGGPLQKVSASGGVPTPATLFVKGDSGHTRPTFLPDGQHFFFRDIDGPVYVASLNSTERAVLFKSPDASNVLYTQGHLLFLRDTTLMAQPFDMRRLVLAGEPVPVAQQIQTLATPPLGIFSASDTGVLAYQTGTAAAGSRLTWLDRAGKLVTTVGAPATYADLGLSRDGKRAAVSVVDPTQRTRDIWLVDLARGLPTRLTFDPVADQDPIWSPDGNRIVFASSRKGHLDLYEKASSGAGSDAVLLADGLNKEPLSWSPDGRFILYVAAGGATASDLWVLPRAGDRKPFPFLQTPFSEAWGQFSPDGRWIAYASNESGRNQVYVAPFSWPGGTPSGASSAVAAQGTPDGKWQVSTDGGTMPRWLQDGSELFYLGPDNRLMVAAVTGQRSGFDVGAVRPLFAVRGAGPRYFYDVSPDGKRVLVNTLAEQTTGAAPITVVVNWMAGMKR